MEPQTLAGLSLGGTLLGGGLSAYGAKKQADAQQLSLGFQQEQLAGQADQLAAQRDASLYQQAIAGRNKELADLYAAGEVEKGKVDVEDYDLAAAQRRGAIVAGQGASGIDIGSASSAGVRQSDRMLAELDRQTLRANADKSAYGYKVAGRNFTDEAVLAGMTAASADRGIARIGTGISTLEGAKKTAGQTGNLGVIGSILGTGTSVADKWLKFKQVGAF